MKKVCVIGIGNMGEAILSALKSADFCEVFACSHSDDPNEKLAEADIFVIAVKPQNFEAVAELITIDLSGKIAISIMAGLSIEKMQRLLKMKKVVRTLPNLPLKIRKAVSCWKASDEISDEEHRFVVQMMESFGESIELKSEEDIVKIGALSGCGPAYFAYLGEQMKKIALESGLNEEQAEKMAAMTFVGSAELLAIEGMTLEDLRTKISSKGGSTEAAIKKFQEQGFDEVFKSGIEAAINRTKELNE